MPTWWTSPPSQHCFPYCPVSVQEICQSARSLRPLSLLQLLEQIPSSKAAGWLTGKSRRFRALVPPQDPLQIYGHLTLSLRSFRLFWEGLVYCAVVKEISSPYFYWKAGTLLNVKIIRTLTNGNEVSLLFRLSLYWNIQVCVLWLILMNYTEILVRANRISLT